MASTSGYQTDALPSMPNDRDVGVTCSEPVKSEYRMDRPSRGLCLIINMSRFHARLELKPEKRRKDCCDRKAEKVKKTFESMGFKCEVCNDLRIDQIEEKLSEYRNKKQELFDSFVCWFLTCRTEGNNRVQLYAYDRQIKLKDIVQPFLGDNCPELVGKPKLFFIEADYVKQSEEHMLADNRSRRYPETAYKIPICADVLLGLCMCPRKDYCYDMQYAETFCDVFNEHCITEPANEITVLLDKIAEDVRRRNGDCMTTSSHLSTFTKHLYLTKVHGQNSSR